jgi:hypothetical protein
MSRPIVSEHEDCATLPEVANGPVLLHPPWETYVEWRSSRLDPGFARPNVIMPFTVIWLRGTNLHDISPGPPLDDIDRQHQNAAFVCEPQCPALVGRSTP